MKCVVTAGLAAVVSLVGGSAALASPVFYSSAGDAGDVLQFSNGDRVDARFRADRTNWDSRLEFDSFPNNGDATAGVVNGTNFANNTFGFEMSYDSSTSELDWIITRPDNTTRTITQTLAGFGNLNIIQLFTVGSRGEVSLANVQYSDSSTTVSSFPSLAVGPSPAVTFKETFLFFGDTFDLLADSWTLSGDVVFGTLSSNNPSEGAKLTVKLREGFIPGPGAAGLFAIAGLAAARRRRG